MKVLLAGIFHETHCFVPDTTGPRRFQGRAGRCNARPPRRRLPDRRLPRGGGPRGVGRSFPPAPSPRLRPAASRTRWSTPSSPSSCRAPGARRGTGSTRSTCRSTAPWSANRSTTSRARSCGGSAPCRAWRQVPLFGVFDLHANLTEAMTRLAGRAGLLSREPACRRPRHRGARGRSACPLPRDRRAPAHASGEACRSIWPPTGTGTADLPMRELEALARQIEAADPGIWAVNVVAGFSFADVADAGVAFSVVTTGDDPAAEAALDRLAEMAMALRSRRPGAGDHAGRGARPGRGLRRRAGRCSSSSRPTISAAARPATAPASSARCSAVTSAMPASSSTIPTPSPRWPMSAGRPRDRCPSAARAIPSTPAR